MTRIYEYVTNFQNDPGRIIKTFADMNENCSFDLQYFEPADRQKNHMQMRLISKNSLSSVIRRKNTYFIYLDHEDDDFAKSSIIKRILIDINAQIHDLTMMRDHATEVVICDMTLVTTVEEAVKRTISIYEQCSEELNSCFFDYPVDLTYEEVLEVYKQAMDLCNGDAVVRLKDVTKGYDNQGDRTVRGIELSQLCPDDLLHARAKGNMESILKWLHKNSKKYSLYRLIDPLWEKTENGEFIITGGYLNFVI